MITPLHNNTTLHIVDQNNCELPPNHVITVLITVKKWHITSYTRILVWPLPLLSTIYPPKVDYWIMKYTDRKTSWIQDWSCDCLVIIKCAASLPQKVKPHMYLRSLFLFFSSSHSFPSSFSSLFYLFFLFSSFLVLILFLFSFIFSFSCSCSFSFIF